MYSSKKYPYQKETYILIGIAMEIHNILGRGFQEVVYKDAFEYELKERNISYEREKEYLINYKGTLLPHKFYADFVIDNKVILEFKACSKIIEEHYTQVINYLAISKLRIGLIINFNGTSLQQKRVVL